ncbi:hypothetical protein V6N13_082750 [Hibiscus sabdariffa]
MYDIVEELGVSSNYTLYWKQPGGSLNVKHLRTDCDILLMNELDQPVRTNTDIRTESVEPVTTYTDVRTELEDDSEDSDYVVVDSTYSDSGFEESDNDKTDEEGFAHDVNVGINHEMDINNLNNDLLGGLPAITLDDENVGFDDLHSASDSDSDSEFTKIRKVRCPEFNVESDSLNPRFEKGMIFGDKDTLKHTVRQYGIKNRVDVKFKRTCNKKVQAFCREGCPWYMWASRVDPKDKLNMTWQIKSYVGEHQYMMGFKNKNATYKWLAKTYIKKYRVDPTYSSRLLKKDIMSDHVYHVSYGKCLRAKNLALEMVLVSHKEQYSMIYDYLGEIKKTNPGSTTILMLDDRVFLSMYICLQACKDGYKAGCRPVLSIDGCHMKGYYGGSFLADIALDSNDNIYPIAYAVVEAKNQSSWSWFLSLLGTDLEIGSMDNFTILLDKQKGLIEAISEVFTCAEHMTCVRHLYSNFKNKAHFKGKNLKDAMWKVVAVM